jgi:phospholipid transport system substrate-binding protein
VDETVEEVLAVLADPALSAEQRRQAIEAIAWERFDFETMSRLVMARNWRKLSPDQQSDFVQQFKKHLSRSYGGRIERYDQESVEVLDERLEVRGDVTVKTRIVGGEADGVEVQYRLRGRDGPWRVIDVVIEGVSLVSSFRSQFKEVIESDGVDGLLERLREKNQAPEGATADAPSGAQPPA